jgi:very-short-patch-repair endonuclease
MADEILTRRHLRALGISDRAIARAIGEGRLVRLRGGLYCLPTLDLAVQRALAAGGSLDCASELRRRGVWVLYDGVTHLRLEPNVGRFQREDELRRHWRVRDDAIDSGHVSLHDALVQAIHCMPRAKAVAAIDSALHLGQLSPEGVRRLSASSERARDRVEISDRNAESGLETFARLTARDLGLRWRSQVPIGGVGRVDLVLEERVVVEADGDEFHMNAPARRRDRERDSLLAAMGYTVLRFGMSQLLNRPTTVGLAMAHAVGSHRQVKDGGRIARRAHAAALLLRPS